MQQAEAPGEGGEVSKEEGSVEQAELVMSSELKLERGGTWMEVKGWVRDFGILFLKKQKVITFFLNRGMRY